MAGFNGCANDLFGEMFGDVPTELDTLDCRDAFYLYERWACRGIFHHYSVALFVGNFFLLLVRGGLIGFFHHLEALVMG